MESILDLLHRDRKVRSKEFRSRRLAAVLRGEGWRVTLEGTQWHTASRFWRCDLAWVNPNEYRLRISEYGATPEEAVQKAHAKAEENKAK